MARRSLVPSERRISGVDMGLSDRGEAPTVQLEGHSAYPSTAADTSCHIRVCTPSRSSRLTTRSGVRPAPADAIRHRTTTQRTGIVSSGSITTCTFFCITQLSVCL